MNCAVGGTNARLPLLLLLLLLLLLVLPRGDRLA